MYYTYSICKCEYGKEMAPVAGPVMESIRCKYRPATPDKYSKCNGRLYLILNVSIIACLLSGAQLGVGGVSIPCLNIIMEIRVLKKHPKENNASVFIDNRIPSQ